MSAFSEPMLSFWHRDFFSRHGDTAVIHDCFALAQQSRFDMRIRMGADTLFLEYPVLAGAILDGMPSVEAERQALVKSQADSLYLKLPKVEGARPPAGTEQGFRDGTRPLVVWVAWRR